MRAIVAAGMLAMGTATAPAAAQDDPLQTWSCTARMAASIEVTINDDDFEGDSWLLGVRSSPTDFSDTPTDSGYLMVECIDEQSGRTVCLKGVLGWRVGVDGKRRLVADAKGGDGTKVRAREKPCPVPPEPLAQVQVFETISCEVTTLETGHCESG